MTSLSSLGGDSEPSWRMWCRVALLRKTEQEYFRTFSQDETAGPLVDGAVAFRPDYFAQLMVCSSIIFKAFSKLLAKTSQDLACRSNMVEAEELEQDAQPQQCKDFLGQIFFCEILQERICLRHIISNAAFLWLLLLQDLFRDCMGDIPLNLTAWIPTGSLMWQELRVSTLIKHTLAHMLLLQIRNRIEPEDLL